MPDLVLMVVTPAATQRLTTVAAAVAAGIAGVTDALIDQASAAIASRCNRVFGRETVTETVRPVGGAAIGLARLPVISIASLTLDGTALDVGGWEIDPASGLLWRLAGLERCAWFSQGAAITYTGGYLMPGDAARTLPHDIERSCLITLAAWKAAEGRDPMLRSESTEGTGSASWIATAEMGGLPPQAEALLAPHVRINV